MIWRHVELTYTLHIDLLGDVSPYINTCFHGKMYETGRCLVSRNRVGVYQMKDALGMLEPDKLPPWTSFQKFPPLPDREEITYLSLVFDFEYGCAGRVGTIDDQWLWCDPKGTLQLMKEVCDGALR